MPLTPRSAPLFLVLSYLALGVLPLALGAAPGQTLPALALGAAAWLTVWAVFQRPAWFHWLLLPAFLALPAELYLRLYYQQGLRAHHLGILAETNWREAREFLGGQLWLALALLGAMLAWWLLLWRAAWGGRLAWRGPTRLLALLLAVTLAGLTAYGAEFGVAGRPGPAPGLDAGPASVAEDEAALPGAYLLGVRQLPPLPHMARPLMALERVPQSWPFGTFLRGYEFYKERRYLADLDRRSASFRFQAQQARPDQAPEVTLLVLGESSRYDRWSLNGYGRATTPLLEQESNLVPLSDMVTPVSATRLAVPVIISRKPARQSLRDGFDEKSFLTAYKEAGFRTWWLSNQDSVGEYDTPVSVFAREADVVSFRNVGSYNRQSNLDEALLAPLRQALADPAPKKLIVLHTLGSHWNYGLRYPPRFERWQPSLSGLDKPQHTDQALKTQMNNSYDNSILYTDWFLAQVIGALKAQGVAASLLYVSDHGQSLYDGSCRLAFHGHNTQYDFHVPAFVWYSDPYRARYPHKVAQLQRHRKARLATENLFHTLLDLSDIRYPDERLEWSFVSPRFKTHRRYVDSYGWSNYDNSTARGDCREIIERGKPLPR